MVRHKPLCCFMLGALLAWSTVVAQAQPAADQSQAASRPGLARLRQLIETVRSKLRPVSPERVTAARQRLQTLVGKLEGYLDRNGENGAQWRSYLALESLKGALAPDADVDPRIFGVFQNRFYAKHVGLEEREFSEVAQALSDYRQLVLGSAQTTEPQALEKQLEPLLKLTTYSGGVAPEELYQASQALGLLELTESAPELVAAVRAEFSRPNLLFQADEAFVSTGMSQAIDRWAVDNSCKKRTFIHSHTHTVGSTTAEFIESADTGVLRSIMQGTAFTRSTVHAGPAIVQAAATTQLCGSIALVLDESGVKAKCATACADTAICFTGFGSTKCGVVGRVVTRMAQRKAPKQRAQSEHEANHKAAQKLAQSLDEEAENQVAKLNDKYQEKVRLPLLRYNAWPQLVRVSTTSQRLELKAQNDSRFQLGAPQDPPAASAGNDMVVRMHETFFNNMMATVFSSRRVTEEEMTEFFDKFLSAETKQERKAKQRSDDEEKPWSIVFADANPVTIEVDENRLTLTIRGRRFESGNSKIDNMKIIVRYELRHVGGEVQAKRDDELYVIPLDGKIGDRVGGATVAQTGPLRKRLEGESGPSTEPVFPKQFTIHPLTMKENFSKVGTLHIRQFHADDGWLAIGWKAEKPAASEPGSAD